jgi:hypothetical protein
VSRGLDEEEIGRVGDRIILYKNKNSSCLMTQIAPPEKEAAKQQTVTDRSD